MPAQPSTVGPYTIESELGRGGMGVVYAARDDRLGRRVAIKSIAPELAGNTERLARFEREVRLLAAVTHPNIATVYGLEVDAGTRYMVMELVEGEPLSAIIDQRKLQADEAIAICAQIAAAIEAAHAAGIVHRDLKPANVIVKEDGAVKVLDFGLARAEESATTSSDSIPTASLRYDPVTREGVALGTPNYMSPEQARGRTVNKSTEIFSFGCVLFECLTGRRAFDGDTPTDAIAALIERDADVSLLPPNTPHRVRLILERCLRKDARERLRDIGDARLELETALRNREWTTTQLNLAAAPPPKRAAKLLGVLKAAAFVIAGAAIAWWASLRGGAEHPTPEPTRFTIDLPTDATLGIARAMNGFDISPDGRTIAYIFEPPNAEPELHIRSLDSFESRIIDTVKQPRGPAFSPDGKWIAYLDGFEHIKRVPVKGGPTQLIGTPRQGATVTNGPILWLDDAHIAYSDGADVIRRIGVETGESTILAQPQHEMLGFSEPVRTPNPNGLLASSWTGATRSKNCLAWIDVRSGEAHPVLYRATNPQVVAGRFVVFNRDGALWAVEFDFNAVKALGEPRLVLPGVASGSWDNGAAYRISTRGDLIFAPGARQGVGRRLVFADRTGATTTAVDFDGSFLDDFAMTRDGTQIAWTSLDDKVDLWVADLFTGTRQRYQPDGEIYQPTFTADGKHMHLIMMQDGVSYAEVLDLDTGVLERIPDAAHKFIATAAADGTCLGTIGDAERSNFDIVRFYPDDEWRTEPLIATNNMEWVFPGSLSPDGKWLLYGSTKSGNGEIYVRRFPDGERDWRLTLPGADEAAWSHDGSSIFVSTGDAVPGYHEISFSVDAQSGAPVLGDPALLFASRTPIESSNLAVTPDDRLLVIDLADWEKQPGRLNVILNWATELTRIFDEPVR
ncbi:MAG: protein kinase [Phycisphaerales bacterium]|nr:protein kinase [Phycisphaerales bacterium]